MKKLLSLILVLTMLFTLAACSEDGGSTDESTASGNSTSEKTESTDKDTESSSEVSDNPDTFITDEPLELTMHMHFRNAYTYKEDWPVFTEAAKLTNINLKGVAPSSATDTQEVFNLLMVSGDLPDIVEGNNLKDDFIKYGMEGAFIPLEDLIEEYQYRLKGVSFLPTSSNNIDTVFPQMPYEEITEQRFIEMYSCISELNIQSNEDAVGEKYCSNVYCFLT